MTERSFVAEICPPWIWQISRIKPGDFRLELWDKQGNHWRSRSSLPTWEASKILCQRTLKWNEDGQLRWLNPEFELVECSPTIRKQP